ncbi:MAG TPA: FHA domain-containing protein [Burkholderiaceae bacterium]|jgi:hypothetical protein|nr:FHA domain-containing protein [Burkholderiaceae bacterium]
MPKMIVSIDGVVIKEVQIVKDRTTLGRRPYNDIVIDNLAVSGEHAVVQMAGPEIFLEDLNSTNGTYINGKAIKKQALHHNDSVEIGKYKIRFVNEPVGDYDKTMIVRPGAVPAAPVAAQTAAPSGFVNSGMEMQASIKVTTGPAAGREVPLTKVVTTLGKPGVGVASITRRPNGFVLAHVEGAEPPKVNGKPVGSAPTTLSNGDMLDLAGTSMQFVVH